MLCIILSLVCDGHNLTDVRRNAYLDVMSVKVDARSIRVYG